jgi:putative membrane protein
MTKGPVLIDLDDTETARPDIAPAVPDAETDTAAMQRLAVIAARPPSRLARWFWSLAALLTGFILSLAAWDYVTSLLARAPVLGWIAAVLVGLLLMILLVIGLRELAAFGRLRKLDAVQARARDARASQDLTAARGVITALESLYAGRADLAWGQAELARHKGDQMDAETLLSLAETSLLTPLDTRARQEVESATRQVAMVTAFVPLALADLITALTANLRMIRRIAEIYGGRAGTLGSWRLTRGVLTHLVATGALAVGDDLIGTVAGGGLLAKVSRRFGEGVVNGALTARVGVAAIEVCRPLPFHSQPKPSVTALVRRALTGLFGSN